MSTRAEREKNKKQHDKHTSILMELLREDQNKYCADCRAKGPRWASWNLGIFVCITCAGIHRNLGVHISKVKSVNLDAWTPEQVKNVQEWGNKRAAEYYEFHLPDGFRRPQGDSSLEQFIRNKYEKKLYVNKAGPPPPSQSTVNSSTKVSQEKKKSSGNENKKVSRPEATKSVQNAAKMTSPSATKPQSVTADLLSLSEQTPPQRQQQQTNTLLSISAVNAKQDNTVDLLNFGGSSFPAPTNHVPQPQSQPQPTVSQVFATELSQSMPTPSPVVNTAQTSNGPMSGHANIEEDLFKDDTTSGGQSKKDSIMALYQPSQKQSNPQMFGIPGGVYLQQQQQQQQMNTMAMNRQQGMTPQYNNHQQMIRAQPQQQQMCQVNQVQQQMTMLGFGQQQPTQVMPNNRAMPNVQANAGYNYNQAIPGMMQFNNSPVPHGNTPMVNGSWMPRPPGSFPQQQQPTPQYVTTGPTAPRFNMYQAPGGAQSGHTLSTNLWN